MLHFCSAERNACWTRHEHHLLFFVCTNEEGCWSPRCPYTALLRLQWLVFSFSFSPISVSSMAVPLFHKKQLTRSWFAETKLLFCPVYEPCLATEDCQGCLSETNKVLVSFLNGSGRTTQQHQYSCGKCIRTVSPALFLLNRPIMWQVPWACFILEDLWLHCPFLLNCRQQKC